MWSLEADMRLWVCQRPVSMRYGIRGLTQMVWSWKGHSPASGDVYVFFSKDRRIHEGVEMGWRRIFDVHKKTVARPFREVLKKGDDGVRRLQWDDFYMLMRGSRL